MLDWVIKLLCFYGNTGSADIKSRFSRGILASIGKDLQLFPVPFREQLARKYLGPALGLLSARSRLGITTFLKRIRRAQRRFQIRYPKDLPHNLLFAGLIKESGFTWNGHKSVICVSHDVDNANGYAFLGRQAALNKRYGIVSTINLLTNGGYSIDTGLINALMADGNEIGLHGYNHDVGFAYRPAKIMHRDLACALKAIGAPVPGFRSPALSASPRLLDELEELGISYDSTFQAQSSLYNSVGINFPYLLYGRKLWELPIAVQDDYFFRDFNLNDEEALRALRRVLTEIHELGAAAVLAFHPHIAEKKIYFYESALGMIRSMNDAWVTTGANLLKFIRSRYDGQDSGFRVPAVKGASSS